MMAVCFTGGPILTMDSVRTGASVVVIDHGRIAAVGDRGLLEAHRGTEVVDLAGRTLVPGFIDAHNHLCIAALHPAWADLSLVSSVEELRAALLEQADREPSAAWLRGANWNDLFTGFVPHRRDLDELELHKPIMVAHYSLHQGVVDSEALDLLGISASTPDPEGGFIGRDANGTANGLLVERAWSEAHARSLAAYSDLDRWGEHIAARAKRLVGDGITCVHDAACPPEAEHVYSALAASEKMPISVLMMPHPLALLGRLEHQRLEGPITGEGSETLRVGPVKLFADGGVAPALDVSMGGRRFRFGIRFDELAEGVDAAARHGFRVAVHAIGNRALADAIEACSQISTEYRDVDHRFRVEHVSLASVAQARQMASLGMVAVVQPAFFITWERLSRIRCWMTRSGCHSGSSPVPEFPWRHPPTTRAPFTSRYAAHITEPLELPVPVGSLILNKRSTWSNGSGLTRLVPPTRAAKSTREDA